ncbi:EamA family transporter [Hymenobacter radiodurans]|uniref:EamA family transporter n=1 Tax=Hymenobacter radiodurans TaxID=2496028 RepID=UPI001058E748|nr:EamA family transporter [Hymenobacter radiodurans]
MNWLLLAVITAFCLGLYNFFIKLASGNIHQVAGAVLLQLVAAAVGGFLLLYIKATRQPVSISQTGVLYSCLAGLSVGIAEILTFYVFTKGAPASVGTPIIVGGSVAVAAVLGWLVLREQITLGQVLGVGLIVAGVVLLARGH